MSGTSSTPRSSASVPGPATPGRRRPTSRNGKPTCGIGSRSSLATPGTRTRPGSTAPSRRSSSPATRGTADDLRRHARQGRRRLGPAPAQGRERGGLGPRAPGPRLPRLDRTGPRARGLVAGRPDRPAGLPRPLRPRPRDRGQRRGASPLLAPLRGGVRARRAAVLRGRPRQARPQARAPGLLARAPERLGRRRWVRLRPAGALRPDRGVRIRHAPADAVEARQGHRVRAPGSRPGRRRRLDGGLRDDDGGQAGGPAEPAGAPHRGAHGRVPRRPARDHPGSLAGVYRRPRVRGGPARPGPRPARGAQRAGRRRRHGHGAPRHQADWRRGPPGGRRTHSRRGRQGTAGGPHPQASWRNRWTRSWTRSSPKPRPCAGCWRRSS
ncbi:protein of unknown function [Methylorubrum extorquens DM4]|uniref:Uncharacterized protein n=1 Tax=Methylorubrum extorquens (strain DSM 6343 / CIP 106787 / DM4) TaxID=661410 RepID=A0A2P9HAT9_METED|nr:protein of unknown function [Methylorubrum extorquens DM4]